MNEKKYRVVDILRLPNELNTPYSFNFYLVLFHTDHKLYEVHPDQIEDIIKGLIYKNDIVLLNDDKIIPTGDYELDSTKIDVEQDEAYLDNLRIQYLPFLTDTPLIPQHTIPSATMNIVENQNIEVDTGDETFISTSHISLRTKGTIVSKIHYKSRILTCKAKYPYFFYVVLTDGISFLKLHFWRNNVKYYQSLNPGETIAVTNYNKNSKRDGEPRINAYQENFLIQCQSIQLGAKSRIYKIQHKEPKDNINITQTHYYRSENDKYFHLAGKVTFMSVLLRKRQSLESFIKQKGKIIEYIIIKITENETEHIIVLFNNSQREFDLLTVHNEIEVSNLWKMKRGNCEFYTNSIYTQIKILDKANKQISNPDISETSVNSEKENQITKNSQKSKTKIIENVLCFLPDNYTNYTDIKNINENYAYNIDTDITTYFNTYETTVSDLPLLIEQLVLSEHKKFHFTGTLSSYDFGTIDETLHENSTIHFDYNTESGTKHIPTGKVIFTENGASIDILTFTNLLANEMNVTDKFKVKDEDEMAGLVSKQFFVIVDAFRVDRDDVIISLSRAFRIND